MEAGNFKAMLIDSRNTANWLNIQDFFPVS